MPQLRVRNLAPGRPLQVGRTGLASFVFALLHPGDAKAATVSADILTLTHASGSTETPFGEIEAVEVAAGWFWSGMRICFASREVMVSGLSRPNAQVLADALESGRVGWWRRTLGRTRRGTPFCRQPLGAACRPTQIHSSQRFFRP